MSTETPKKKPSIDQSVKVGDTYGTSQLAIHARNVTQIMSNVGVTQDILKEFKKLDSQLEELSKTDALAAARIQNAANALKGEVAARPKGASEEGKPKPSEQEKAWWRMSIEGLKTAAIAVKDVAPIVWDTAKDLADKLLAFFGL